MTSKSKTIEHCKNVSHIESISLINNAISKNERNAIIKFIDNGGLGEDPSSKHFIRREKCIRFIVTFEDNVLALSQDYFIQESAYNEFSGGYKRYYKLCPESVLQGPLLNIIKLFIKHNNLPTKSMLLIQLQSSYVKGNGKLIVIKI